MVKRQGFTLIETVAVLAIVASVAVIAVHRFPTRQRQQNAEQAFWRELQTMWQQQTLTASVTGQPQVVSFRGTEVVTWGGKRGRPISGPQWHLPLPATLKTERGRDIQIQKNGHPQLAVVIFKSQLQPKQKIRLNALMGWGPIKSHMLKTRMGFLMIETITALGLLMGGLIGFESLEIMMQSHERQTLQAIQTARKQYEDRQRQQLLSRIPEQAHD
ncbi:type II secretion system protein [Lactiplantibacillus plantarum]|uniref:type II secretion system protein n=1 Tax=Lactiplantibacillus plantarum TaxID=1590 RepID=UPI0034578EDC